MRLPLALRFIGKYTNIVTIVGLLFGGWVYNDLYKGAFFGSGIAMLGMVVVSQSLRRKKDGANQSNVKIKKSLREIINAMLNFINNAIQSALLFAVIMVITGHKNAEVSLTIMFLIASMWYSRVNITRENKYYSESQQ